MPASMKILAFAASNSRHSINKQLVTHSANVLKAEINPDAEVTIVDLNDFEMPIYSIDREQENGIPDLARAFFKAIGETDALLISYAVHNGTYTVAYKNIFDWCSRINAKVFQDKPMVIMSTSPGKAGGASVLKIAEDSASYYGAVVRGSVAVPSFSRSFNTESQELSDPELAKELRAQLANL